MNVIAHINTDSPTGRKLVKQLQYHKKVVQLEYPQPLDENGRPIKTISAKESAKQAFEELGKRYNTTFENEYTR
ncbi:hypothetical protein [Petrimonas sp.]|uniref:hypothetical protein n=1 Tax=Petrimonas sp. TaxID=2023866 RepID=UPI003F510D67